MPWYIPTVTVTTWTPSLVVCVHATRHPLLPYILHIIVTFDPPIESQLYSRASLRVRLQLASQFSTIAIRVSIYIYIYFSSISDLWIIPSSIVSHPLPLFIHNRHKNRTSIHREYYYIFFFFIYIYTFFIIQTRFYLLFIIYNLLAISRRARLGEIRIRGGGYRPPRYLSIYPLSIRDFVFIFRSFFRTRKRSETANGRRMHAISGETDSREYFTENTKRSLGVFALGGKRVEMGEGKGGRGGGAMKTPQLASPESSTSFTFFPSWSIHTFHSVHPFHRFSPEILEYRRSIFLMRIPE